MGDRELHICDQSHRIKTMEDDIHTLQNIITGGDTPQNGVCTRLFSLEGLAKQLTWVICAVGLAAITVIVSNLVTNSKTDRMDSLIKILETQTKEKSND